MSDRLLTIHELLYEKEKEWKDKVYLRQALDWEWHDYTWGEVVHQARKVATFLKTLGLKKGDTVSILSRNCAEWFIVDFGIMLAGMVSSPLYTTLHKDKVRYILEHSESKAIFLGRLNNAPYLEEGIPDHLIRIDMGYYIDIDVHHHWKEFMGKVEPQKENYVPKKSDLSSIIYTSGTTGNPKGVMVTYETWANLSLNIKADIEAGTIPNLEHNRGLSYLPLAHIAERAGVQMASLSNDKPVEISFVDSLETFLENMRDTQPTVFFGVPRIWVQLQQGILMRIKQEKLDLVLKIPIFRDFFKRRIRRAIGLNKSILNVSGAAPITKSVLEWWKKLGITIVESYGQTETLAWGTSGIPGYHKAGTVGKARANTEIIIADNGELLIKTKTLMPGYYKNPEATAEAIDENGFFKSGDKAEMDEYGNYRIIGRVKDTFKTDKGEFVDPVPIEDQFAQNEYTEQLCLLGLNLVQPVLVILLNNKGLNESRAIVEKSLKRTLDEINKDLASFQKVSHIYVAREEWTPENEMLAATLKIRRNKMAEAYTDKIKASAKPKQPIIWE